MTAPRILAFAGSTRRASFNRRLLALAVRSAETAGLSVNHVELADYPMPIFNQDLEAELGQDPNATRLRRMLEDSDALLLACPEYNASVTPLMKNVIDWLSRAEQGGAGVEAYKGKKAMLIGASPGRLGARRAMTNLADILDNVGVDVYEERFSLPGAGSAFDEEGNLADAGKRNELDRLVVDFAGFVDGSASQR